MTGDVERVARALDELYSLRTSDDVYYSEESVLSAILAAIDDVFEELLGTIGSGSTIGSKQAVIEHALRYLGETTLKG